MRQYYGLILLALSTSVAAGEWTFTPRFNINETYTNNVLLVENGEEGDFITMVSPGLSVRGEGPRLSSNIDYNLQQRYYLDKTRLDGENHQLQGNPVFRDRGAPRDGPAGVPAVFSGRWLGRA